MNSEEETALVSKWLEESATANVTEILEESLLLVHEDERNDRRQIDAGKEPESTKAPLSWLYVTQIKSLISKNSRKEALEGLESSIWSLTGSIEGHSRNRSPNSRQTVENPFVMVHREYGESMRASLSDLRRKIENKETELEIVNSIKTVFDLTFSLYYKEKGCTPSAQKAMQRLHNICTFPCLEGTVAADSAPAANVIGIPHHSVTIQPHEHSSSEHRIIQNVIEPDVLTIIFTSHIVPMTPVVARRNGVFVSGTNPGNLQIMPEAYAYVAEDGMGVIPAEFCLNDTYTPQGTNQMSADPTSQNIRSQLTYVGCCYPDGTSLSYIPINYVRLEYERNENDRKTFMRTGAVTFTHLDAFLPNAVYQEIKQRAKNIFLRHHPNTQFVDHHETQVADDGLVKIEVLVKSERAVRIQDENKQLDYPILQALFKCGHDICGPSLMHMRFTTTKRGLKRIQLRLLLFGITVRRTHENYNDAIFDLFQCPPGPIHNLLPVPSS